MPAAGTEPLLEQEAMSSSAQWLASLLHPPASELDLASDPRPPRFMRLTPSETELTATIARIAAPTPGRGADRMCVGSPRDKHKHQNRAPSIGMAMLLLAAITSPSGAIHAPVWRELAAGGLHGLRGGSDGVKQPQSTGGVWGGGMEPAGLEGGWPKSDGQQCLPRMLSFSRVGSFVGRSRSQPLTFSPPPEGPLRTSVPPQQQQPQSGGGKGAAPQRMAYASLLRKALELAWPSHHAGLQLRVFLALGLIAWSRVANLLIPQLYKAAVDRLSPPETSSAAKGGSVALYICAYAAMRAFVALQSDVKNLVFTPVAQYIKRHVQLVVFSHLHSLSHRYHLGRKTGTILQVMPPASRRSPALTQRRVFEP